MTYGSDIKKTPVVVGNCTGFAVNRVFFPYTQASCMLVDLGLDPYMIDMVILKGFGMPMGPFRCTSLLSAPCLPSPCCSAELLLICILQGCMCSVQEALCKNCFAVFLVLHMEVHLAFSLHSAEQSGIDASAFYLSLDRTLSNIDHIHCLLLSTCTWDYLNKNSVQ